MPAPPIVRLLLDAVVMAYALAFELNVMPLISVIAEIPTADLLDEPKMAESAGPFGTAWGTQFVLVFQSEVAGALLH